ncbi:MAG: DUF2213 domain-containing protein [archaeon]
MNANGREYLVVPAVVLKEKVYDYPEDGVREFLPRESIAETVNAWSGVPVTVKHPDPDRSGNRTARRPDAYTETVVGQTHDPDLVDGTKLRVNAWIDVDRARSVGRLGRKLLDKLEGGEVLSVSPGYATMGTDESPGRYNGVEYDRSQGVVLPDHLAIFPSDEFNARCSPEEGCAAPRANALEVTRETSMTNEPDGSVSIGEAETRRIGERFLEFMGITTNTAGGPEDDGPDDPDGCACGGTRENASSGTGDDGESTETTTDADADGAGSGDDPEGDADPDATADADANADADADADATGDEMTDTDPDGGSATEADPDDEQGEPTETEAETQAEAETQGDADVMGAINSLRDEIAELKAETVTEEQVDEIVANAVSADEIEEKRETIVNALDFDEEAAADLSGKALDQTYELALEEQQQTTTNYGAVPGTFDRTPEPRENAEDGLPVAGGRTAYEQRKREEGDD